MEMKLMIKIFKYYNTLYQTERRFGEYNLVKFFQSYCLVYEPIMTA